MCIRDRRKDYERRLVAVRLPRYHGQEICLYRGRTMGHKAICAFPTMRTGRLRVKITSSDGPCRLRGFKAYYDE